MVNVFAVPVFFIVFRECLETTIIVSVLLSFLKQTIGGEQDRAIYKKLRRQVWMGILAGLGIVLVIGCAFIGVFYGLGKDYFSKTEDLWEGVFGLIAAIIITLMGAALLRVSKLQKKWRLKLAQALEAKEHKKALGKGSLKRWSEKYAMFLLPFVTVLREGIEAVVFIGGVSLGISAEAFPLAVICGLGGGIFIGWLIYKGGNFAPIQIFLVVSTCFLYLVGAGLFSKSVWSFQINAWNKIIGGDAAEVGSGPGSYDPRQSVWHVNCCNAEINGGGGWGVFNSILGWENSATYGSVISYNLYWVVVIIAFLAMGYRESKGHFPLMKSESIALPAHDVEEQHGGVSWEKGTASKDVAAVKETDASSSEGER